MKTKMFCGVLVGLFTVSSLTFAAGITAEKIVQNMVASYEEQMKGVKDITIVKETTTGEEESVSTEVTYQKIVKIGGKTVYKSRTEMNDGKDITIYDGEYTWESHPGMEVTKRESDYTPEFSPEAIEKIEAEYIGTETIDGHKTYVLRIKNMAEMMGAGLEEQKMGKVTAKAWIDINDLVMRKMEMNMEQATEAGQKGVTAKIVMKFEDYRKVHGMFFAYKTSQRTSQKVSDEMIKQQLEQVPEAYRKQMEAQMKAQMGKEQIRTTKIKSVKVNTGLSNALFDGSKLK